MGSSKYRCIIHGSFSKHFEKIKETADTFSRAGIEILAPKTGELMAFDKGFALFEDEIDQDPRLIELIYLHNLRRLGENGFSYFVNPGGYIGTSASYELGIAQVTNIKCFFSHKLEDHPAYIQAKSVWNPNRLVNYIQACDSLPLPKVKRQEKLIHQMWKDLIVPGSIIATGAIIEHQPRSSRKDKEILLVKTHKWGNRYSIVGGKVRRNERLDEALLREVKEETKLSGQIGAHICTFDQIRNSGYYKEGIQQVFVDNIVAVKSKRITLNEEAQDYIWALPYEALQYLDIEPNARTTIELYLKSMKNSLAYS